MAQEQVARLAGYIDVKARNADLARYTETMRRVAAKRRVTFVDLFTPTAAIMTRGGEPLTINGIHVNDRGDAVVGEMLLPLSDLARPPPSRAVKRSSTCAS